MPSLASSLRPTGSWPPATTHILRRCVKLHGEQMKSKNLIFKLIIFTIFSSTIFSVNSEIQYGNSGDLELASGLFLASTSNSEVSQNYSIGWQPYANHFLFDHWLLRYSIGTVYNYNSFGNSKAFNLSGGLAIGYSFPFSERIYLNLSAGYTAAFIWSSSTFSSDRLDAGESIDFYLEPKYAINEKWFVSVLIKATTNIDNLLIFNDEDIFRISTNTFIVVAYLF